MLAAGLYLLATSAVHAEVRNLTVYRVTPQNYSGLTNMNSADAAGDLLFGLYEFALPVVCDPQYNDTTIVNCQNVPILSIPGFNVYTKSVVEVDTRFGVYSGCNPNASTGVFHCEAFADDFLCWYNSSSMQTFQELCDVRKCHCPAWEEKAVGIGVCNMCEHNATWHHASPLWSKITALARTLNGSWYSTLRGGECRPGQRVGEGSDPCWWRLVELERRVNETCVSSNVVAAVLKHGGSSCLSSCPQPSNRSSACWINCFFDAVVGDPARGIAAMTRKELLRPFLDSFATSDPQLGGCPDVPPCPPPCRPHRDAWEQHDA